MNNFVITCCKQFVSQHRLLNEFLNIFKLLLLLLHCSPLLSRERTGSKFLVTAQFCSDLISAFCPHVILLPPFPSSSSVTHPAPPQQDHLCVNASHSFRDVQPRSSASSLTSLSLCNLPDTSSLSMTSELSPETMLAEIAQLSRENEMIKAQLRQAREHGSRLGGLPSNGQRRLSSSSTGRVVPQSVGEKSTSLSNCTVTKSQQVQAAEGHKLTHQVRLSLLI